MAGALLISTEPFDQVHAHVGRGGRGLSGAVLQLEGGLADEPSLEGWTVLKPTDLVDAEAGRRAFLAFLEDWPQKALPPDRSFDEAFTVDGKHSLWWTSVGADRHHTHGIFKYFNYAALVDRAIERCAPEIVYLLTQDPMCLSLVRSRARDAQIAFSPLPGCAGPVSDDVLVTRRWLVRAVAHAFASPLTAFVRTMRCRWALRASALYEGSSHPTIVFASRWNRNLALQDGQFTPVSWREVSSALKRLEPSLEHVYLPRRLDEIVDGGRSGRSARRGVDALRTVRAPLLISHRVFPVKGTIARIVRQVATLWRFYRVARHDRFRRSFHFANTDMAPLVLPDLREAVGRAIDWSFRTAQVAKALRVAGNVKAVLVSGEMYRPSMPILAAAEKLGIPTLGVQHGNIWPAHLTYTLPQGHVRHAPTPNYFAAYGEYAREVLSGHGAYPGERVWITGPARLDPLASRSADVQEARAKLGLPPDRPVVVLATQTFPWFASAVRALLECVRDRPDVVLCVKKHPSAWAMPLSEIDAMAAEIGVQGVRGFESDIDLLLAASSVWVSSATSTTIVEAALLGKPTICVNFSDEPDGYPYVEEGVSLPGRSVEDLKRSLDCVLTGSSDAEIAKRRRAILRRHVGPTVDGHGAFALASRVVGLLGGEEAVSLHAPSHLAGALRPGRS